MLQRVQHVRVEQDPQDGLLLGPELGHVAVVNVEHGVHHRHDSITQIEAGQSGQQGMKCTFKKINFKTEDIQKYIS